MNLENMEDNYKLAKWLSGEMTGTELEAFKADPDFAIYEKIKAYSSDLIPPDFDQQKMVETILASPKQPVKTISLYKTWLFRVAAIIVLGLGLVFTYSNLASMTVTAENGKQSSFLLPDASQVVLNSGSEIEYKKWNWDNHRSLELQGEAYFKVAKGKKFEVNTALGKVTVLGTQFNVKQRDNSFDVRCYEGRVKVNYKNTEVIITKGMSVAFRNGQPIPVPENTTTAPEWLNNEMVFNQEDLKSILSEFERHFNVTLELKSSNNTQLFTGTIPAENIEVALQVLSTSYHLKPVKTGQNKFILTAIDAQK